MKVRTYFALPNEIGLIGPHRSENTRNSGMFVFSEGWIVEKGFRDCFPIMQDSHDFELNLIPICCILSVDGWNSRSCMRRPLGVREL